MTDALTTTERNGTGGQHAEKLSLSQVREMLAAQGVSIGLDSLSDMLNQEGVADLLKVGGGRNKRELHPDTVTVLAAFIPRYKEAKGRLPQFAQMLTSFLQQGGGANALAKIPAAGDAEPAPDPVKIAEVQGRAQGLAANDVVLDAKGAAEFLGVSTRTLRKSVPPYRRFGSAPSGDRWRKSDLLQS